MRTGNLEDATRLHPKPRAREGKMEKSFFTFQAAHPDWKCSASGQSLVERVEEYRLAAMTRERELHIEAAARQLETLARLEKQQASPRTNQLRFETAHLKDLHYNQVPVAVLPADAGAGIHSSRHPIIRPEELQQHHYNQEQQQNSSTQTFPPSLPSLQHPSRSSPAQPVEVGNMNGVLNDARNSSSTENASAFFNARTNPPHVPLPSAASVAPLVTNDADSTSVPYPQGQQQGVHANSGSTVRDSQTELSSELSRLFLSQNFSTDDGGALSQFHSTDISTVDLPGGDRNGGRQYYWLERFHEHLEQQHAEEQQQQQSSQSHSVPGIRRNVNTADAFPGPSSITDDYSERAVSRSMPTPTTSATDTPVSQTSNGTTPSTTTRPPARGTSLDATSTSSNI